jgi:hypothetical protein
VAGDQEHRLARVCKTLITRGINFAALCEFDRQNPGVASDRMKRKREMDHFPFSFINH